MSDQSWFNRVALGLTVVVLIGFAAGLGLGGAFPGTPGRTAPTAVTSTSATQLYLTIAFNPGTGMDQYFPANFTVPAHQLVMITITNYDNGTNVVPSMASMVAGTVGNVAYLNGMGPSQDGSFTQLSPNGVVHTFSVLQSPYDLNVPIPPSPSLSQPSVVIFSAYFNQTGAFVWFCQAPCDSAAMEAAGFMSGTVTVAA